MARRRTLIIVKSEDELEKIESACRIVAETLDYLASIVKAGISTGDLDRKADEKIRKLGGVAAFKGYRGYPASICTSVNSQVVHGIPSVKDILKDGDIVSIDLGVIYDGFYGDAARTFAIGEVNAEALRLMQVTEESLWAGIEAARAGNRVSDIGHAVQTHVEQNGFSVVRSFVGHGIGKQLHEEPQIPNFGVPGRGPRLSAGMTLAIEPMVNAGKYDVVILDDGWTSMTKDGSLSAHFEHTIAVTQNGPRVLTKNA